MNYILSISIVIKVNIGIHWWLSCNPYTAYNSICSKLILKLQLRNLGIQITNINMRHGQQQTLGKTEDV